jgi:hypothetical protein
MQFSIINQIFELCPVEMAKVNISFFHQGGKNQVGRPIHFPITDFRNASMTRNTFPCLTEWPSSATLTLVQLPIRIHYGSLL